MRFDDRDSGPKLDADAAAVIMLVVAFLLALVASARGDQRPQPLAEIPCTARYQSLTPYELIGFDSCGQVWKMVLPRDREPNVSKHMLDSMGRVVSTKPECWFWDPKDGTYMQVPCPANGDTTGFIQIQPE